MGSQPNNSLQSPATKMKYMSWSVFCTISWSMVLVSLASAAPGRDDVEDDINQLMNRFMFDDYDSNYDYGHIDQELHFADEQPSRPKANYKKQNNPVASVKETKEVPKVQEASKEAAKESESAGTVDPQLRDF